MRVLIPGGNGFLGTHLVQYFRNMDHEVFVPDREFFDLRLTHAAAAIFDAFPKPDVVVHCAAVVGGIGANQRLPAQFLADNVLLNTNMVVQARRHGVKKFVGIGSVCGYPHTPPNIPFVERDFLGDFPEKTNAPYGYTKRLLLMQLQAEHKQYGLEWSFVIPTNLYGPGDSFDEGSSHVIPALLKKFHEGGNYTEYSAPTVDVWGTGLATRDFLYVTDACEGIYRASNPFVDTKEPINLGSGEEISIADLAGLIAEMTPFDGEVYWQKHKPDGQPRRVLDISRAATLLNWRPKVSLSTGLDHTYRHWLEGQGD